jgi:hypothetical protein
MAGECHLGGTPAALSFLRRLREDAGLTQELRDSAATGDLETVVRLAATAGYEFSAQELRAAHRVDWQLRRAAYAASAASTVAVVNSASSSR